jgi:hypothetical protein
MAEGEELGLIEDGSGAEESGGEETFAETETETEEGPGAESETPGEEGGPGGEEPPPSRALPTELRKAFREFIAGNPEFAKRFPRLERQLTDAMFKTSELGKLGGLQQLRSAAEVLENHGGPEGIREMAEEVEASRMMEEGFQQGDPVLIDTWAQEYPDGFKMLVGPALEKLATLDLAAHDRAISSPMYQTLDRCGVIGTVNDLEAAIAGERYEDIAKHFGALKNFLMELRNFASKAKAPDPLKADRDKLAQEREEMQTERVRGFYGHVRTDVNTQVMAYTNRLLRQELAGRKLRVDTANRVRKQVNEDLAAAVNTAPGYAERYKAIMGQGDHGRAVGFIVAAARQKLPLVVKRVLRDFNLGGKPGVAGIRRTVAGGGPRTGTTVAGRPKTSDVDFTRTDKATWLGSLTSHGEAWLKNGKKARW